MRARSVKPAFFKNEQLAECSYEARLLFIGLWCLSDREGIIENRPKRIKIEIFPYDNIDIVAVLKELEQNGLIIFYSGNYSSDTENYESNQEITRDFIYIPNFVKHQNPHKNEQPSAFPKYSSNYSSDTENYESNRAESLLMNPEKGILNTESISNFSSVSSKPKKTDCKTHSHPQYKNFIYCFNLYPVKKKQEESWNEWFRLFENGTLPEQPQIIIGDNIQEMQNYDEQWQKGFIPTFDKYLSGKRWNDQPFISPENRPKVRTQEEIDADNW